MEEEVKHMEIKHVDIKHVDIKHAEIKPNVSSVPGINVTKPDAGMPLPSSLYQKLHATRIAKVMLFLDCFGQYDEFGAMSPDGRLDLVCRLERSCYNYTIDKAKEENIMPTWTNDVFGDLYHSICYKISSNVDRAFVNNTRFALNVISGVFDVDQVPRMSSKEMYPAIYDALEAEIRNRANVRKNVKVTSMYRCRMCHKRECTIQPRYNRSLDEGTSLTITCQNCSFEWCA